VSPERNEPIDDQEHELYEDVPPRSIFAATWFRVVLVVIVLGVVGAVAVPYVLDWMNPPPAPRVTATARAPLAPAVPLTPATSSGAESSASDKPMSERPATESKDSATSAAPSPPPRAETRSEPRPSQTATAAKPVVKPEAKRAEAKGQSAMAVTDGTKASAPKPGAVAKPEAVAKEDAVQTAAVKPAAPKPTAPKSAAAKTTSPAAAGGPYWVQIGAFKDAETAKRLAAKLREENFKVEESIKHVGGAAPATLTPATKAAVPAPAGADQYDVFVTGMSVDELNRRLAGKGLSAEASGGGVIVKPSMPLRDAVALSKDLAVEGFKVQVRRAGATGADAVVTVPPTTAPVEGGQALHRVRVGAFTDRAAAQAAARELESKGFKPYIARGDQ
jgi:DedD protein